MKPLLIAGMVIAGAVLSLFVGILLYKNRIGDLPRILPLPLLLGAVVPFFVAPTLLVSIRFEDGYMVHRLCRRWTLTRKRISDLTGYGGGGAFAVIFYFADGSKLRFLGADFQTLSEMYGYIHTLRPDLE
jgi:hypothetical protein